jgi:2-iminoacetate synthase
MGGHNIPMSFLSSIDQYARFDFTGFSASVTPGRIADILSRERIDEQDYLALLSPAATMFLEPMAQKAADLTRRHFGNVVFIFTPLYISNYCDNVCAYCSFGRQHSIRRRHMEIDEIKTGTERIAAMGIRHILVLTGESRRYAPPAYLEAAVTVLRERFSSIAIEVYPLTGDEYGRCIGCGIDGLTIYQETYDRERYHALHQGGPKNDFVFRLDAPERACRAGIRTVTVGALLGIADPVADSFSAVLHAAWLQKQFPGVEVSLSFPRMRPLVADFAPAAVVSDRQLVQMILAARLFLPTAGITVSTRESAIFRNNLLPLGVTRMSAGVSTAVGGHSSEGGTPQFEIADTRSVRELQRDLEERGFQPVMHDWNTAYCRDAILPAFVSP